jgi:hypothetical protein
MDDTPVAREIQNACGYQCPRLSPDGTRRLAAAFEEVTRYRPRKRRRNGNVAE